MSPFFFLLAMLDLIAATFALISITTGFEMALTTFLLTLLVLKGIWSLIMSLN